MLLLDGGEREDPVGGVGGGRLCRARNLLRVFAALLTGALVALTAPLGASSVLATNPPPCLTSSVHWWAQSVSGYPAAGNRLYTVTPLNWSVDYQSGSTMLEASILTDNFNYGNTIEGGYFSGLWPYSGLWYTGLLPYYALESGFAGNGHTSTWLPANTAIYMDVFNGGPARVGGQAMSFSYTIPNPQNWGQGEIKQSNATWMGNGSGNRFVAYWSPDKVNWYPWGWHSDCADSPYWVTSGGANVYTNGGY